MNTDINLIGLAAALATFLGVWFGHMIVRKVEYSSPTLWQPVLGVALLGLLCEYLSLRLETHWLSAAFGILGITMLWDAFEFKRQEKRVKQGHAPANPANPRHKNLIMETSTATVIDLIDRNPVGHLVSLDEAIRLIMER